MNNLEVIIGIEIHVELKTKSKIFSSAGVNFNQPPNSQTHPIDLGYPGTMPSVNKKAVELALVACKILNMQIDSLLQFDRKNYYYADLAKGFQITQQDFPIGKEGYLEIVDENNNPFKIEIERLHLEEDTAKQLHEENTLLDYNRSGIGLIEIVTKPVLRNAFQASCYVETLREMLLFTEISDAKMNEGSLRCDVNISLRPYGFAQFGNKVEIKNLNSINNVEKAIEYEINRQSQLILKGKDVEMETRRYDEKLKQTVLMRKKTGAVDYRYFREPNIIPIKLDQTWIENIINNIAELPQHKKNRYVQEYNIKPVIIETLFQNLELIEFFEQAVMLSNQYEMIGNYLTQDILAYLNQKNISLKQTFLTANKLVRMIELINDNTISTKQAKTLLLQLFQEDQTVDQIIEKLDLKQITDPLQITSLVEPLITTNQDLLQQYSSRPERVIKFFMGELMKLTKGKINPEIGQTIVVQLIEKNLT